MCIKKKCIYDNLIGFFSIKKIDFRANVWNPDQIWYEKNMPT